MNFKASVFSNPKRFATAAKKIEEVHLKAAQIAALEIMNEAKLLIQKTSPGEKQVRYNPKRTVTASKPGDPPNTDTGRLINSIKFAKDGNAYKVGTNLSYGAYLEFGTKDLAPRPWLSVALAIVSERLPEIMKSAYDSIKGIAS